MNLAKYLAVIASLLSAICLQRCSGNSFDTEDSPKDLDHSKQVPRGQVKATKCTTEENQIGECLPYLQCPELKEYKAKHGLTSERSVRHFRKRFCGYRGKEVRFCCLKDFQPSVTLPNDACGTSFGERISQGVRFQHGAHPWLVGLGAPKDGNKFHVACGGTLITKRHVLTAAHCYGKPSLTHVILGEHDLTNSSETSPSPVVIRIAKWISAKYNNETRVNDIGVIVLENDVEFTPFIQPACLPSKEDLKKFDFSSNFTIVGWGDKYFGSNRGSNVPLEAKVKKIAKEECIKSYNFDKSIPLDETMICLGGNGRDTCQGDSGGPLLYEDDVFTGRSYVVGVTSFGFDCGNPKYPGVYTYVPEFMDWIQAQL